MIQRKQTIYLFLAALLAVGYFVFPFSSKTDDRKNPDGKIIYRLTIHGEESLSDEGFKRAGGSWYLMAFACMTGLLPFYSIFMFRNRKQQIRMSWLSVLMCICLIALVFYESDNLGRELLSNSHAVYLLASYIPLFQFLFLRLAIVAIRKDEELIRSVDRIRWSWINGLNY